MICSCFDIKFLYIHSCIIIHFVGFCFTDVNECVLATHNCDVNANCTNTVGSFNCSCNTGYSGDGVNCSKLITV